MATTKQAQYRFTVKEGPPEAREVREGVIQMVSDPFLIADCCDDTPAGERPFPDPDFLALRLHPSTSLEEAERIARFLDEHIAAIGIVHFGDAEDLTRGVDLSEKAREIDFERLSSEVIELKQRLASEGMDQAIESLKAIESICAHIIRGWADALKLSQEVLARFGEDGDADA